MRTLSRRSFICGSARAALALALGSVALAVCSKVEDEPASSAGAATGAVSLEGRHLVFAGYDAFKPFRYIEKQDDGTQKVVGYDIAVADELAKRLGFTYEFKAMPFASILASVQDHQADFSMGFTKNDEREKVYDFTQGYFQPRVGVVSGKDFEVTSVDQLKGKRIGVVTGTVQYTMAQSLLSGEDIHSLDTSDLCLQELLSDRIDAYICDGAEAVNMAEPHPELRSNVLDKDFSTKYLGEYHVMGYEGADFIPVFDAEIKKMKDDGTLDSLITKWVGSDFTYGN